MINCGTKIAIVKTNEDKYGISAICKILKYQEALFVYPKKPPSLKAVMAKGFYRKSRYIC